VDVEGEESLIRAAALGDRIAFDELVRRHLKPLLRYATRLTDSPVTAEDITQETFLAAWRGLPGFTFRSSFRTWLFTIASRKTMDLRRRRSAVPVSDDALDGADQRNPGPYAQALGHSLLEALEFELGQLSPHSRACWWLREVEGLSHDEIAVALAISRGSVRGHLQRSRAQLALRLAPWKPASAVPDGDDGLDRRGRGGKDDVR
jgi:RNA polymerase sigma-70 factor (ECF subfamily)